LVSDLWCDGESGECAGEWFLEIGREAVGDMSHNFRSFSTTWVCHACTCAVVRKVVCVAAV